MNGAWMWGMGLWHLFVIVLVTLVIASLVKCMVYR
jgi:hypothetical protein